VDPRGLLVYASRDSVQKVLGQTQTSFRSAAQELAMRAILQGESPLVVVLPTGGGKSFLFKVPACLLEARIVYNTLVYRQAQCAIILELTLF
jgi:superfamily II DNA helicase RecQ